MLTDNQIVISTEGHIASSNMIRIEHSASKIGFFGATPVTKPTALTAAHAALTQAGSDSGDVAIQAITNSSPYGFANAAEGEAVVACVRNLMTRQSEMETKLIALGLLTAAA